MAETDNTNQESVQQAPVESSQTDVATVDVPEVDAAPVVEGSGESEAMPVDTSSQQIDYRAMYEEMAKQMQEFQRIQYEQQLKQLGQPNQFKPPSWETDMPEPLRNFAKNEPEIAAALEQYTSKMVERYIEHRVAETERVSKMQRFQSEMFNKAQEFVGKELGVGADFWSKPELSAWVAQNRERYAEINSKYPPEYLARTVAREFLEHSNQQKVGNAQAKKQTLAKNQQEAQATNPPSKSSGSGLPQATWRERYSQMRQKSGIRHI